MKHPVDTSIWGEFKVGELFDMFPGRRLKKGNFEDGDIPFVMASSYNNGVVTTLSNPISTNKNFLTADIFGNVFYQKELVGYGDDNCGLKLKYRDGRPNEYLFLATMISSISVQASFTNKLRGPWYIEQTIPLPLKPDTNPADYSQEDIDWDYMESFMSRVQDAAKERLANLPEPGQKSKTPVDVSKWGEFKVGELFEFSGCKQVKSQHNLIETDKENGIPFVVQSNANNMVKCYVTKESLLSNNETIYDGNAIMLGVMTPVASYQEHEFGASQSIALRAEFLNPLRGLFIATIIKSVIEPKYNYANIPGIHKYKNETIPLPLKPGTNPSDYSQDDIHWDYIESFMSQFQTLAKNRVERLT